MREYPKSVHVGEVYPTKDGDLIVENYINANEVYIRFVKTGFTRTTTAGNIRKGAVKDLLHPNILDVGYLGSGKYLANSRRVKSTAYICWHNILKRCYCAKYQEKYPWYKDCTVDPLWHNFQNFAEWYYQNYIEGYELDKDIKVFGNKVYSPDTCMFVEPIINRSHKSSYTLRTRGKKEL